MQTREVMYAGTAVKDQKDLCLLTVLMGEVVSI